MICVFERILTSESVLYLTLVSVCRQSSSCRGRTVSVPGSVVAAWSRRGRGVVAAWSRRGRGVVATWSQCGCDVVAPWLRRGRDVVAMWSRRGCGVVAPWSRRGCDVVAPWLRRGRARPLRFACMSQHACSVAHGGHMMAVAGVVAAVM